MRYPSSTSCFKFGTSFFLIKLNWYQNKAKTNRFLTSNQSFNSVERLFKKKQKQVFVLRRVICLTLCLHLFQALADTLCINRTIEDIDLGHNQIGDDAMKVWWVEHLGVWWCESGWIPILNGSDGKSVTGFDQRFLKLLNLEHGCPPHLIDRFTYYDLTWLTLPRYVVSLKLPMPFYKHVGFMKWQGISPLGCFKGASNTEYLPPTNKRSKPLAPSTAVQNYQSFFST